MKSWTYPSASRAIPFFRPGYEKPGPLWIGQGVIRGSKLIIVSFILITIPKTYHFVTLDISPLVIHSVLNSTPSLTLDKKSPGRSIDAWEFPGQQYRRGEYLNRRVILFPNHRASNPAFLFHR